MTVVPQNIKTTVLAPTVKQGSNPGVGLETSLTVPAGKKWIVHSVRIGLTTSATVATRRVHIDIIVGGVTIFRSCSESTQAASEGRAYNIGNFGSDKPARFGDHFINMPIFPLTLPSGAVIQTFTESLQAGDDYNVVVAYVDEFDN